VSEAAQSAVELSNVSKTYDSFVAVDDLSIAIPRGSIFGLLGPNGAGKSSSIRMMIGITVPDSGEIRIFGEPISRATMARVGYLPEERGLYRRMTALENLAFLGQLRGLSRADAIARAQHWAVRMAIEDWMPRRIEELSKGMQQKVQFVAALIHDPEFIILDEPFAGLDPLNTIQIRDVITELRREGRTILFSTHRMDQVEKMCDAICLMNRGRAIVAGDLREVKSRAGRRSVRIECAGGAEFLTDNPAVDSINSFGSFAEIKLRDGANPDAILRAAIERGGVTHFELIEPSLEQIFIDAVGAAN
jgi:ABC-2 type transport system ATP-binding protein